MKIHISWSDNFLIYFLGFQTEWDVFAQQESTLCHTRPNLSSKNFPKHTSVKVHRRLFNITFILWCKNIQCVKRSVECVYFEIRIYGISSDIVTPKYQLLSRYSRTMIKIYASETTIWIKLNLLFGEGKLS